MPHPVAVLVRGPGRSVCPWEAPLLGEKLRRLVGAPVSVRAGRGFLLLQAPEPAGARLLEAAARLLGGRARLLQPPEPASPWEALEGARLLAARGLYWLAHEALEHAWREHGARWLHPAVVATGGWAKAQEGDWGSAWWILGRLLPRSLERPGVLRVDPYCAARAGLEAAACMDRGRAGECLGPAGLGSPPGWAVEAIEGGAL